jgi:hypothetical protein
MCNGFSPFLWILFLEGGHLNYPANFLSSPDELLDYSWNEDSRVPIHN